MFGVLIQTPGNPFRQPSGQPHCRERYAHASLRTRADPHSECDLNAPIEPPEDDEDDFSREQQRDDYAEQGIGGFRGSHDRYRYHPDLDRAQLCRRWFRNEHCRFGSKCKFSHKLFPDPETMHAFRECRLKNVGRHLDCARAACEEWLGFGARTNGETNRVCVVFLIPPAHLHARPIGARAGVQAMVNRPPLMIY